MKILQLHSEYSTQAISGENLTVSSLTEGLSRRYEVTSLIRSTQNLHKSNRLKISEGYKFATIDKVLVQEVSKYDIVLLHNPIPFFGSNTLKEIAGKTKLVRIWHNFRNLCIKGSEMRNGKLCQKCSKHYVYNSQGIVRRCYRESFLQSSAVAYNEASIRKFNGDFYSHIAISDYVKDRILSVGIDPEKVRVIPNGVPAVKRENKVGDGFLMMGRFDSEKGFREGCLAWTRLPEDIREKRPLYVAGDGYEMSALKKEFSREIQFLGKLTPQEINSISKFCSSGIVPSQWQEPFGRVAVEYMALGLRPLVTPVGGLPEIIRNSPHGLIANDTSIDGIYEMLLADSSYSTNRANQQELIEFHAKNYSENAFFNRWYSFIDGVSK